MRSICAKASSAAFAMHGLRDCPRQSNDQLARPTIKARFAAQKTHKLFYPCCRFESTYITSRFPALI